MRKPIELTKLEEQELEALKSDEDVRLAQKEQRLIYRKRKYLTDLRWMKKRGARLRADGWTYDTIDAMFDEDVESEIY